MTEIVLERLDILNFKGIEKLSIVFDRISQNIWGANGTCKTSIADAFHWLLFGKNSAGESDFGIKPLNPDGTRKEKTEVEVSGMIDYNGRKVTLRHRFIEVWKKKKGSEKAELDGNTHEYFVDNAPYTLAEYKAFINRLVDETIFPLITNPLHFNRLPWQKRREVLLQVSGDISNQQLAEAYPEFKELISALTNKTLSKYKQEVLTNKKLCKDQLDGIPTRIDEVRRGMPEPVEYDAIAVQIQNREESLAEIDNEIASITKAGEKYTHSVRSHQANLRALQLDQDKIASDLRSQRQLQNAEAGRELRQKKASLDQVEQYIRQAQDSHDNAVSRKQAIQKQMDEGREAWKKINAETFEMSDSDTKCPTCHQELPYDELETKRAELKGNFDKDKDIRLQLNVAKGAQLKKELAQTEDLIQARAQEIDQQKADYDGLVDEIRTLEEAPAVEQQDIEDIIKANPQYIAAGKKIAELEAAAPTEEKHDLSSQQLRQKTIRNEIDELRKKLRVKDQRADAERRIEELKQQETDIARDLDKWERIESLIERFTKVKIDTLTDRINDRFSLVKFKMFNYLQNGGVEETCEVMVDGVPYSDLNTASRINAGIDVINVLSAHYGAMAPIIVDNRESIVDLLDTRSQVINLIVREGVVPLYVGKNPPVRKAHQESLALQ